MAKLTNKDILTRGQKYFDKKKAKKQIAEVTFDADDRLEYLTGFHKRKVQRQKVAQDFKEKQLAKERLEERQRIREERRELVNEKLKALKAEQEKQQQVEKELEENDGFGTGKKKVNFQKDSQGALESNESSEEEWKGFDDEDNQNTSKGILKRKVVFNNPVINGNSEELDETTVTIESISTNDGILGNGDGGIDLFQIAKLNNVELDKSQEVLEQAVSRAKKYAVLTGVAKPAPKSKKKKFRYLSKNERRENTRKERSKRFKKKE